MIAACASHIPLPAIPAHVVVIRGGRPVSSAPTSSPPEGPGAGRAPALFLQLGDRVRVAPPGKLTFSYGGNRFRVDQGQFRLVCRSLALDRRPRGPRTTTLAMSLGSGRVTVRSGVHARRALVLTPEMLAFATARATDFVVSRNPAGRSTRAWTLNKLIVAAKPSDQPLRVNTRITYTAIADRRGLHLDIWPFSISALNRVSSSRDRLPPFWRDGLPCSVGCTARGVPGWPLKPFRRQHAIRAGINELRPANFHVGVDIEANDFQPVYAIQSGFARIRYPGTGDVNVDVGNFFYWHVNPTVRSGQHVVAYRTQIGQVLNGFGHVALSEGSTSDYLNPLRPGGSLRPYHDSERPIIGIPRVFADGRVIVASFDPQSFVQKERYETPVLAPSSLAWRLYDAHGRAATVLEWAMRGSQNYPPSLRPVVFAPGAANPGFACFFTQIRCIPNWVYWLAGGLTPPLPLGSLPRGRYRLAVYAWDWAGNTSALDYWLKVPLGRMAAGDAGAEFGPLAPRFDYP